MIVKVFGSDGKKMAYRCPRCGGIGKENIAPEPPAKIVTCRRCNGKKYIDGYELGEGQ